MSENGDSGKRNHRQATSRSWAGVPVRPVPDSGPGPLRGVVTRRRPDPGDAVRLAGERAAGGRPQPVTKRVLTAISRSIEHAVLDGPVEAPTVVVSLFQRPAYFEPVRGLYERLVAAGAVVVAAFVDGASHHVPDGVHVVALDESEALADEWSVVALGPQAGAFTVAADQHTVDPDEPDLEAGRLFTARWGYALTAAAVELARLRLALGRRLSDDVADTLDALLGRRLAGGAGAASSAGTPAERWATTSLFRMAEAMADSRAATRVLAARLDDAAHAVVAGAAVTVDRQSGLASGEALRRWSNASGATALPVGVGLFDLGGLTDVDRRHGYRTAHHAVRRVAAALTEPLGAMDLAVRVTEREFAVVLPGASPARLAAVCDDIADQLLLADDGSLGVDLRAAIATVVTATRPLPLRDLHDALAHVSVDRPGPIERDGVAGDRITALGPPTLGYLHETDGPDGARDDDADPLGPVHEADDEAGWYAEEPSGEYSGEYFGEYSDGVQDHSGEYDPGAGWSGAPHEAGTDVLDPRRAVAEPGAHHRASAEETRRVVPSPVPRARHGATMSLVGRDGSMVADPPVRIEPPADPPEAGQWFRGVDPVTTGPIPMWSVDDRREAQ